MTGGNGIDVHTPYVLLNVMLEFYNGINSAIKYGIDKVTLDVVMNALKHKKNDFNLHKNVYSGSDRVFHLKGNENDKSKPRYKLRKCYNYGKPDHYISNCPNSKKNQMTESANVVYVDVDEITGDVY